MRKFIQMFALVALMAVPWATNAQNGWCTPSPSSKDGDGITNVTFGTGSEAVNASVTWSSAPFYNDYRSQIGAVAAGTTCEMSITYATGYTYGTIIWVDWDQDSTFEGTEIVWVGASTSSNPTTLSVSFDIASTQDTGTYAMRICAADMAFDSYTSSIAAAATVDPCGTYSWGVALDFTLRVTEASSCLRVASLSASNILSDGLTLNWVDTLNSTTYTITYWPANATAGDTVTINAISGSSYTLTNLESNTLYYFSILPDCTDGTVLPRTASFKTDCANGSCDITVNATDSYGDGWNGNAINVYQAGVLMGTATIASGSSATVQIPVCSGSPVNLTYTAGSYATEMGGTVTDGGGNVVFTISNMSSYSNGATLETIADPCPTCIPPMALTVVPDSNEILFSWTPRSGAGLFIVYLNDSVVAENVTDTFYTFMGLNANTAYTVKVQSVCSSDDSSSIVSRSTRTACGQITLPYTVDFEDAAYNGAWYPCWDSTIHAGTDPSVNDQNSPANHTAGGTYAMYLQGNGSEPYNLVVTPQIPTAGNNIYVRFWARVSSSSGRWIQAGVMTNPYDSSTFIPMVDVVGNSWNEYEFHTDTLDASATYYVAWLAHGSGFIGKFDDVYISEIPSCLRVPEVSIDTTTSDAITLSWADNGSNSYTVYYWATGSTDTLQTSVSDTTATLSGLQSLTGYSLYVVANCASGDAEPSPVYTAATTCAASVCNLTAYVTDSYNDSWNGCGINIVQAGVTVATIECPSGQSGSTYTYEVCSSAPVTLTFTRGNYPNELGGTITDGGGNTVFTISGMNSYYTGDVLATVANPCPTCVPPTDIYLSDTTVSGVTIHWTAQAGQTNWIVRVDSTDYNVTDTFYTATGLLERTAHTIAVATDCSGDTSTFMSLPFITGCAGGECEIVVASTSDYAAYGSSYASYAPMLAVMQNGAEVAVVQNTTDNVSVCSSMPVTIICRNSTQSWADPTATVINGGDEVLFNGSTSSYTTGDTLVYMANACPSCLKPTGVMPQVIDSNQITFIWTVEPGYTYQISFDNGAYTTNNTGVYTAYGLLSNTAHTFAVRTICSVGDTSNPRIINVKSACGEMAIPYVESFEADAYNEVPSCWTVVSNGEDGFPAIDDNGHTGEKSLTFVSSSSNTAMIASSRIPLPGDSIKVSFWAYKYYGYGTFEAGVMTNPYVDSSFIPLTIITSSSYEFYEFNTNTLSHDSSYYLAFRYDYNSNYYYAKVDDINITLDEGCMTPTNVIATPDTVNTNIHVSWNYSGALNNFVVEYRATGDAVWNGPLYSTTTSKTITGLTAATTYEIRVGMVCGTDTLWASTTFATTRCDVIHLPYEENFVSATGELPPCWDYTNSTYFHWNRWTTHAETSGDGEMMAGSGSAGEAAILPPFYAPIIKLQISFDAKLGNVSEGDGMMMGVYNESTNTVEWLDTLTNPGQSREDFVRFTYNYLNYTGSGTRIAIGHSHNANDWGFALDSVVVIELNACNPPENITANNTMYPNTADDVYFTWTVSTSGISVPSQWQLYIDTITSTTIIDSVPESQLITVDTTYYMPPINTFAEGAHYRLFVRSICGLEHSDWVELQNGFSTDEFWMNNSNVADTIVGCDFIIYDNGGPVAGYLHNSNSALVIQAGEAGRELQIQGGFFSHGDDANTFTVYDGIGTSGTVLYTRNTTTTTVTFDSVLATSTTGAMTITFTSGYYAALGYELYIHCVGEASCTKPTNLMVEMIDSTTAYATWDSTGASFYRVYHHTSGDSVWNMNPTYTNSITLTGLPVDVNYDFFVVAYCSATDTSAPSITRHFNTHYEAPCYTPENLQVTAVSADGATLSWTSTGTLWDVAIVGGATVRTSNTSYVFTGLTTNTQYCVRVRNVCDSLAGRYSAWSDTICFTTLTTYTLTVASNNNAWGTVTGGGTYTAGTTAHLVATANNGYHFMEWQEDHNTEATRDIIVTDNATYTAIFAEDNGIEDVDGANVTLFPNPASATVTIGGIEGECIVTVVDLNGREVYKANANNNLTIDLTGYAKGAYFVRITGERTAAIRKLIVK